MIPIQGASLSVSEKHKKKKNTKKTKKHKRRRALTRALTQKLSGECKACRELVAVLLAQEITQ